MASSWQCAIVGDDLQICSKYQVQESMYLSDERKPSRKGRWANVYASLRHRKRGLIFIFQGKSSHNEKYCTYDGLCIASMFLVNFLRFPVTTFTSSSSHPFHLFSSCSLAHLSLPFRHSLHSLHCLYLNQISPWVKRLWQQLLGVIWLYKRNWKRGVSRLLWTVTSCHVDNCISVKQWTVYRPSLYYIMK